MHYLTCITKMLMFKSATCGTFKQMSEWEAILRYRERKHLVKTLIRLCMSQCYDDKKISSPGVVSLSRIRKEPSVFPGARRSLMASFLEMFLKNHLQHKHTICFTLWANHFPSLRDIACIIWDGVEVEWRGVESSIIMFPVWRTVQSPPWSLQQSCVGCSLAGLWWETLPDTTLDHPWMSKETAIKTTRWMGTHSESSFI